MRKYRPIYSLVFFCLLSISSAAQDSTYQLNKFCINLGFAGSPEDVFDVGSINKKPHFTSLDMGFNIIKNNLYFGINTGQLTANFEYEPDTSYKQIKQMPLGFTFGIWSKSGRSGVEFSSGFLFPQASSLPVKGGTYFSGKGLLFMDNKQNIAIAVGYKSMNNMLTDYTHLQRSFITMGLSAYIH